MTNPLPRLPVGWFVFSFSTVSLIALTACGSGESTSKAPTKKLSLHVVDSETDPESLPPITAQLRNTHYYTIYEVDYADSGPAEVDVLDVEGSVLVKLSKKFYSHLLLEGTAILADGRVLNYAKKVDGTHRFRFTKNEWGNGVGSCALVPFRTIAVDADIVPVGSTVYIDETVGMPLPDGTTHDGFWRADDIGGAINHDRVDIYVGRKTWRNTLDRYGIDHMEALTVRIVALPESDHCALQPMEDL